MAFQLRQVARSTGKSSSRTTRIFSSFSVRAIHAPERRLEWLRRLRRLSNGNTRRYRRAGRPPRRNVGRRLDQQLTALDRRLEAAKNYRLTLEGRFATTPKSHARPAKPPVLARSEAKARWLPQGGVRLRRRTTRPHLKAGDRPLQGRESIQSQRRPPQPQEARAAHPGRTGRAVCCRPGGSSMTYP